MNRPLLISIFAVVAVLVAGIVLDRTRMAPEATATGANSPDVAESRAEESTPANAPNAFAATAGEYQLDAPRRRDEHGRPLPFRERALASGTVDLLRNAQTGNFLVLELFPGITFRVRVTGRWNDGGETRVAARLDGRPKNDRLFGSWQKEGMRTLVELPSENLAYEIVDDGKGGYMVREWLFTDVICATPSPETRAADAGIPPPEYASGQESAAFIEPGHVPQLNSRPESQAVIYLDFDGETVTSTAWNNGQTIIAQPARMNASQIEEAWRRIVRDFETFDVNVTTVRSFFNAAPITRRIHCVITPTSTAAPGAGGVAYVNVFTSSIAAFKVCWVFMDRDAKGCAEAASHEIGHTLGLSHDGRIASGGLEREEYYEGHGSGATGWAPIMGVGYYRQLTQWSRGEYNRANNQENDLSIITAATQAPYIGDDHSGTENTATAVSGDRASGRVERNTDADFFSINLSAGSYSLVAQTDSFTNLDIELQVRDALGNTIATANQIDQLNATATFTLSTHQTVFLRVAGAGRGDVLGTGYSNYSSLGAYTITGFGNQQQPPSPPIGLSLSRISGTQMRLTWTPNPSASTYAVFRDGTFLANTMTTEFVDTGLNPSTSYSYSIVASNAFGSSPASDPAVLETGDFDEFIMDGNADFPGYLVSNPGMTIYTAVRGTKLYVATWSPGDNSSGAGNDHHIFVSDSLLPSATTVAPWTKRGLIAIASNKPYLAGESASNYAAWFNTAGPRALFKAPLNSGVLEGTIDLVAEFGSLPENVYIAAIAYQTDDAIFGDAGKGKINSQAPSGNGNDDLEPGEFFRIPVRSVRDAAQNGTYDILDAARSFAVTNVSFNASNQTVLRWPVVPGKNYMVQGRGVLSSGAWTNLLNTNRGAGPTQWDMEFTDIAVPGAAKYYRVTQP